MKNKLATALKKTGVFTGLFLSFALVLIATFIIIPPANFSIEKGPLSLSAEGTDTKITLWGKSAEFKYKSNYSYEDHKTLYFESMTPNYSVANRDSDIVRKRLSHLGDSLYDIRTNQVGQIEITVPSWIDNELIEQYVKNKGELQFLVYTFVPQETPHIDPETGEFVESEFSDYALDEFELNQSSQPMVSSIQILHSDIKSVSYSSLQSLPTVEIKFNDPSDVSSRVPASLFTSSENQQAYISLGDISIGEASQTVYQINGEYAVVAAYQSPWELKSMTLLLSEPATTASPEDAYRLLSYGPITGDWTLARQDTIPAKPWQPIAVLALPLFAIIAISAYLFLSMKRIDWIVPTVEGFVFMLFATALVVRLTGIPLSPPVILTLALPSAVFSHMIVSAANLTKQKMAAGATLFTSMKASLAEAQSSSLIIFGLLILIGIAGSVPPLLIMAVSSGAFAVSILVIKRSISKRASNEQIAQEKKKRKS